MNGTLAGAVGLGLRLWLVGIAIWAIGHVAAVWAAKRDPLFVDVVRRHLRVPAHLTRHASNLYPDSRFPDAASALVDAERKADFEEAGAHFESSYFLTFTYLPPAEDAARAESWLYEGREKNGLDPNEVMTGFADRTDRILRLVEAFMPECHWLDDAETLTYLHGCVSTKRHRVRVPDTPIYLDALLADQPLTGGLEPRLGASHLRILTVTGFPTATTPGLLDELNRLAFPYHPPPKEKNDRKKLDAAKAIERPNTIWISRRKPPDVSPKASGGDGNGHG
ncbi:hypothetical protein SYNPS1DRAFT_20478 [Syncephalis pseudoplumigaleata]|uniref:Uncharacterized protein n=1 Tax=Syncephalis pseudoplumigaleata TaxID=1712513 RepID=A0A4P9Z898_9FUNG|nr:hypothetical protein SYNPS1DRAFT_20478 [Syncephalis pseudoplumigaleata]|eukprot:RKP28171.1 hypothetical protein SYNPS1DRAFT_20478 [Syncephalis pseudoplumigaleata]